MATLTFSRLALTVNRVVKVKTLISPVGNRFNLAKGLNIPYYNLHSTAKGFTLVELMAVLVIIALVMGLVATSLSRSVSAAESRVATRKLVASLRYTRTQAMVGRARLRRRWSLRAAPAVRTRMAMA